MRNSLTRLLVGAGAPACLVLAAGCAHTPAARFYLLEPAAQPVERASAPAEGRRIVGVREVRVEPYLDRPQMVTRAGDNEIRLAEFHRWAEPLEQNVQRVVAANLAALLPSCDVYAYPWPDGVKPDCLVEARILRFDAEPSGEVALEATWALTGGKERARTGERHCRRPFEWGDYRAQAAAMSDALAALCRDMADAVSARGP